MTEQEVVTLMESSKSVAEWDANCNKVQKQCGGYPPFWYKAIILSGLCKRVAASFGETAGIKVYTN
jgi:hypothetical protein